MKRLYGYLFGAVLLLSLSACGEDQHKAGVSDREKEAVAAAPVVQSVSAVQAALSGDSPAVFVDPGQDSIPPSDQPPSVDQTER